MADKVQITEWEMEDLDAFVAWQSDPDVARHVAWLPKTHAESQADLLDAIAQQTAAPRIRHFFAVVRARDAEVVGDVGFTITAPSTGDCGWFIRKPYWGLGYATEAARMFVAYAFQTVKLDRLKASCSVANPASERVMTKCGFTCVNRSETRARYEITRDDWARHAHRIGPAAHDPKRWVSENEGMARTSQSRITVISPSESWKSALNGDSTGWLLEMATPSVRYLAPRNLLDRSEDDIDVTEARSRIMETMPVRGILSRQLPGGYWGKPYWNQGYCSEAGKAVLQYAFAELGLLRIHASHIGRNPASGRVMRKLGMQHEGSRRQHVRKGDECEDLEVYGILRNDMESHP